MLKRTRTAKIMEIPENPKEFSMETRSISIAL
jgi:hypothetical protein